MVGKHWPQIAVTAGLLAAGFAGCTRTFNVAPLSATVPVPTNTPTLVPTSTPSATFTNSPTGTPANTATSTATGTPANTSTFTATSSPTNSPTVTATSTPTASPTPNCGMWTFEDGTADNWSVVYNTNCSSDAVTSLAGLAAPASLGSYGLDVQLPNMTHAGCGAGSYNNDVQAQVTSSTCPALPVNFTAKGLTGVKCMIWANPDCWAVSSSEGVAACPYLKTSGYVSSYGGCYSGWTAQSPQAIPSPGGQWMAVTLVPSGAYWSTDETQITGVGIDVNVQTANQPVTADVVIDDVEFY